MSFVVGFKIALRAGVVFGKLPLVAQDQYVVSIVGDPDIVIDRLDFFFCDLSLFQILIFLFLGQFSHWLAIYFTETRVVAQHF